MIYNTCISVKECVQCTQWHEQKLIIIIINNRDSFHIQFPIWFIVAVQRYPDHWHTYVQRVIFPYFPSFVYRLATYWECICLTLIFNHRSLNNVRKSKPDFNHFKTLPVICDFSCSKWRKLVLYGGVFQCKVFTAHMFQRLNLIQLRVSVKADANLFTYICQR